MVKTRRKNYVSFRDATKKSNVPVHLTNKKAAPKVSSSINLLDATEKSRVAAHLTNKKAVPKVSSNINLLDFSNEILTKITSYLTFDSLANLRLVCRRLNDTGVTVLIQRTNEIIRKYGELVKFSPSNMHPDVDACCVLQCLCHLEKDMKNHKNTDTIFFPIMILDKATKLLSLMLESNVEKSSLKEEQTKNLVQLIHKKRCTDYNSTLAPSPNSRLYTKINKHKPITYP